MLQRLIPPSIFLILFLAVILFAPNVAEANNSPTAVGTISGQTLVGGETTATVDVSSNFNDPDDDTLTYTASSSDETQVTVSVSGATVTLTSGSVDNLPVVGTVTVTVTATDPDGLTATQTISVTVVKVNRAPTIVTAIPDIKIINSRTYDVDGELYTPKRVFIHTWDPGA